MHACASDVVCAAPSQVVWSYGPVVSYRMRLAEVDTVGSEGQVERGLLHVLIWKQHSKILLHDGLMHTLLQQVPHAPVAQDPSALPPRNWED